MKFLHQGEDDQLYYFDYEKDQDGQISFRCNFIDLKLAMEQSEKIQIKKISNILYQLPLSESYHIGANTQVA